MKHRLQRKSVAWFRVPVPMWECRLLLASSPDDALGPSGSGGSIPGGRRGVNVDRVGMLEDHPIGVVCDTRIDAAAPLHLAEAYPGLGVAPQVDAACGVSDRMLAASHRIAAGHAGVLSAYVVVAHAGVVGLMARYALDLVNQKKGGSVEPPFRLVTRSYSGVTPWRVSIVFRGDRRLPTRQ